MTQVLYVVQYGKGLKGVSKTQLNRLCLQINLRQVLSLSHLSEIFGGKVQK